MHSAPQGDKFPLPFGRMGLLGQYRAIRAIGGQCTRRSTLGEISTHTIPVSTPYQRRTNAVPMPLFFDNLAKGVRSGWGSGTPLELSPPRRGPAGHGATAGRGRLRGMTQEKKNLTRSTSCVNLLKQRGLVDSLRPGRREWEAYSETFFSNSQFNEYWRI